MAKTFRACSSPAPMQSSRILHLQYLSQGKPMPSCRRRHRPRPRRKKPLSLPSTPVTLPPPPPSPPSEQRDWAALPQDILLVVFLKLGPGEIIQGADLVCRAWRRVAVDEPMLWWRLKMGTVSVWSVGRDLMQRAAIDRGAGQCEAFSGSCCDRILLYLVKRAPSSKSLHLSRFHGPNEGIHVALKNLPLLEDLDIWPSYVSRDNENLFESVCQACPLLKNLRFRFRTVSVGYYYGINTVREKFKGLATTMCELRSLQLFDCDLTDEGLTSILDYCPVLESLYITGCFDGEMDRELRAKCDRVKDLTLPYDTGEDSVWIKYLSSR
ncbi:unnamed protein product [Urochloa decumbens]|uniref:F-box domain-containing protein n=1 Tax=Urochloa decumbens TaxID=240449 RepID=A0ABC9BXX6_9POAL